MSGEERRHDDRSMMEALIRVETMSSDITEIKGAMRQVAEAITRLAVVEERQTAGAAALGRAFAEIDKVDRRVSTLDTRVATLEQAQPLNKKTTEWVEKVFWLVIGAITSAILSTVLVKNTDIAKPREVPVLSAPKQ